MVMNREKRDLDDALKGPNTTTIHFDETEVDEEFPDSI